MWITRVQLSDIKSYGKDSPPIEFRPGVNLIQGQCCGAYHAIAGSTQRCLSNHPQSPVAPRHKPR